MSLNLFELLCRVQPEYRTHAGQRLERSESAVEITYSDKIGPVTFQPDLQYVKDPGADGGVGHALVAILRIGVEF